MRSIIRMKFSVIAYMMASCLMLLGCEGILEGKIRFAYKIEGVSQERLNDAVVNTEVYERYSKLEVVIGDHMFSLKGDEVLKDLEGTTDYYPLASEDVGDYEYEVNVTFVDENDEKQVSSVGGSIVNQSGKAEGKRFSFESIIYYTDIDEDGTADDKVDVMVTLTGKKLTALGGSYTATVILKLKENEDTFTVDTVNYESEIVVESIEIKLEQDEDEEDSGDTASNSSN